MDTTEGSETSEKLNLTPGKYPKENIQVSEHGENLKSRVIFYFSTIYYNKIPDDLSKCSFKTAGNFCNNLRYKIKITLLYYVF
jgi:hypothetical protein